MTGPALTRRAVVQGAGAALGAAVLPGAPVQPMAVLVPPAIAAASPAFDAAGFVADLRAAGFRVWYVWPIGLGGELRGWPSYSIRAAEGRGLGDAYSAVVDRWRPAMVAEPDHERRIFDFLEAERMAATAGAPA